MIRAGDGWATGVTGFVPNPRACAKMKELLDELGPSPFDEPAGEAR